jgi:hypothetical protein
MAKTTLKEPKLRVARVAGKLALTVWTQKPRPIQPRSKTILDDRYGTLEFVVTGNTWKLLVTVKNQERLPVWQFPISSTYAHALIHQNLYLLGIPTKTGTAIRILDHQFHDQRLTEEETFYIYKAADYLLSFPATCQKEIHEMTHIGTRLRTIHLHEAIRCLWDPESLIGDLHFDKIETDYFFFPIFSPANYLEKWTNRPTFLADTRPILTPERPPAAGRPRPDSANSTDKKRWQKQTGPG